MQVAIRQGVRDALVQPEIGGPPGLLGTCFSFLVCEQVHRLVAHNNGNAVPGSRSPKSRCGQGPTPSGGSGGGSFLASFLASGGSGCPPASLAYGCITQPLPLLSHGLLPLLCVLVSLFSPFVRTPIIGLKYMFAHLTNYFFSPHF